MKEQFPRLYSLTNGSFNENLIKGLELDLEFQPADVKRELREYREFQEEFENWHTAMSHEE